LHSSTAILDRAAALPLRPDDEAGSRLDVACGVRLGWIERASDERIELDPGVAQHAAGSGRRYQDSRATGIT
jgi:hypothetical protein